MIEISYTKTIPSGVKKKAPQAGLLWLLSNWSLVFVKRSLAGGRLLF